MTNFEKWLEMVTESEAMKDALRKFNAYRNASTTEDKNKLYDIFFASFWKLSFKEMKEFYSIINEHYDIKIRKIK